jgi:dihydrofolate synthase/folylpolyglutamate synthase
MEYLGPDREAIGLEKAHVMRAGRPAIVSDPMPPRSVVDTASDRAPTCGWWAATSTTGRPPAMELGGRGRASTAWPTRRCAAPTSCSMPPACWPRSKRCASGLPITAQAVRNGLALVDLPGRFQIVPGQPTLVLDVAHNPQSVAVLARNLDAMGFYPRTHAVFGAMRDKDMAGLLRAHGARWSTPGTCATCRRRAPRRPTNWPRCWATPWSAQHAARPAACAPRRPRPTPPIESWSSGRSSPSVAC